MSTRTLVIEKWETHPEPKWTFLREVRVETHEMPKRVKIVSGIHRGKVFDRQSGNQVSARDWRSWYRYSLKIQQEQAA